MESEQLLQEEQYGFPYHYLPRFEQENYTASAELPGFSYMATLNFLIAKLKCEKINSAIDLGCGDGRLTMELSRAFPTCRVVGCDYSERAISLAKVMSPGVCYECRDIIREKKDLGTFDCGMLIEVLEHIPDDLVNPFLDAIAQILNVNGFLYITVPHVNIPQTSKHYRHYTVESLCKTVEPFFNVSEIIFMQRRPIMFFLLRAIHSNPLFICKIKWLNTFLYKLYYKKFFLARKEKECSRIFMKLTKKE
jgi:SAM-dependent methyltransferase